MTLLGILSGGLWFIPLLMVIGIIIFLYKAYVGSKSNSTQDMGAMGVKDNTGNVSMFKSGYFVFAVILVIALISFFIIQVSEK